MAKYYIVNNKIGFLGMKLSLNYDFFSLKKHCSNSWWWNYCHFIIDIYVTVRLIQILRRANKNASQIYTNMNSKRSAFTAVMYWNFLRLSVALLYHIIGLIDILGLISVSPYVIVTLKTFVNIALSYVITVDAEIVRNIEGRDT